jgi:hypothetical protein
MDDSNDQLSKCEYYLRKPNDGLSEADFEAIKVAAMEWSRSEEVNCEIEKSEDGFVVTFHVPPEDEEAYCMSFYLHIATDTLLHLENRGLWMTHHDD